MAVKETDLPYPLLRRGKVREMYDLGDRLLLVASDRISAFDVVMPNGIPRKGEVLTRVANFWFERTRHIIPNHLSDVPLEQVVTDPAEGDSVTRGERIGIIRFGSRVDLFIPPEWEVTCVEGDRVKVGETVVARIPAKAGQDPG